MHGHLDGLERALEIGDLNGDPGTTRVLLGDYVDRGPSSRQVLELTRGLQHQHGDRVVALLGNHDC